MDKVQTRKKQKTGILSYEKLVRLNFGMKRALALVETMRQRERLKLAIVNEDEVGMCPLSTRKQRSIFI